MSNVIELKSVEEFAKDIEQSQNLALVDFYATWCGPCKMQTPIIDRIADTIKDSNFKVYKVDVDELTDVAVKYGISAVPSLLLFKNGQVAERWVGLTPEHILREIITSHTENK